MRRQFTATVLLDTPFAATMTTLAEAVAARYPQIGAVNVHSTANGTAGGGVLEIEGALIAVMPTSAPFPQARMAPPLRVLRSWDPIPAVRRQTAHVTITCGGALPGIVGAKALAAAVTFVTAAVIDLSQPAAVFWETGWAVTPPETFVEGADKLSTGIVPLPLWATFATVVPRGVRERQTSGTVTYGLGPFIGAELELAPAPIDARASYERASMVARLAMGQETTLRDGLTIRQPSANLNLAVVERESWLREGMAAFVLVSDDSLVDPQTLKPRAAEFN